MPVESVYLLEAANMTVSNGGSLSGITQGDASHLLGETITFNSRDWVEARVDDGDTSFDDNDANQTLDTALTLNGVTYAAGSVVEAEYTITLQDPDGNTYVAYGFNVRDSSPPYATVEGLCFLGPDGSFPPAGVPLTVIDTDEGPGSAGNPATDYPDLVAPICFAAGTLIAVPGGLRAVEELAPGDRVVTRDNGVKAVRWVGSRHITPAEMASAHEGAGANRFAPIRIRAGALGPDTPRRDLLVSPQHRILVSEWRAELNFGEPEVLVAARHLVDGKGIVQDPANRPVTYVHVMLDSHEILLAEGVPAESFRAGRTALGTIPAAARAELLALFPGLRGRGDGLPAARPVLRGAEARVLAD